MATRSSGACGISSEVDAGEGEAALAELAKLVTSGRRGAIDGNGAVAVARVHLRSSHRFDVLPRQGWQPADGFDEAVAGSDGNDGQWP